MRAAGEATRQRILAEARREFAEHGLAGARINRIATNARASKERLYAYFATKDELFDAVCAGVIRSTAEEAQLSADDVPGFAGRLFDIYIDDPDIVRLYDRISMDGKPDFRSRGSDVYGTKTAELRRGQRTGAIDPAWDPAALLSMILGLVRTMASEHHVLIPGTPGRPTPEERRAAVIQATRKLIAPHG
ncbi:TetR family transcriptional regulator [Streptomyces liangshanensis]|uniref:TetR family transcriptional regulator n=1 Tax=Streptomyces liangshanensis TaxID=2717324 RepID=UPI0036DA9CB4